MSNDLKIQTYNGLYTGSGTDTGSLTGLGLEAVSDISKAFIVMANNRKVSGGPNGSSGNQSAHDLGIAIRLSGTDEITVTVDGSVTDLEVSFIIIEYVGTAGGPNEFIVRDRNAISISNPDNDGTDTITDTPDDIDACIPVINGVVCTVTSHGAAAMAVRAWLSGTDTLNVNRGSNNSTTTVYVTTVEFTGSNWTVGHGTVTGQTADSGTISLVTGADGTTGSSVDVGDWGTAFWLCWGHAGDDSNDAIADHWPVLSPGSATDEVDYTFHTDHDGSDDDITVHVLQHDDLVVNRYTSTDSSAGESTGSITTVSDIDYAFALGTSTSSGTGTAYGRGWRSYYLTDASTLATYCHRSGNTCAHNVQVVEMDGIVASGPTITDVDSDYGAASDEFDADEDSLDINGASFDGSGNEVYLSDVSTLAGGANEVDISAAIQTEGTTTINLDLTALTTELASVESLIATYGHDLYLIVNASGGEVSIAVTVHRAKAFQMSASTHITASGEDTTEQLSGTGTFGGGRIQGDENPGDAVDIAASERREDEWSIAAIDPSDGTYLGAQDGETYQFRVLIDGVVVDTYTVTPQLTISAAVNFDTEQASEIDSASDVALTVEPVLGVEEAGEVDTASDVVLAAEPVFVVEQASEVDAANDVAFAPEPVFVVEQASEIDSALDVSFSPEIVLNTELASEIDAAVDVQLSPEPVFAIEQATEVDTASDPAFTPEPVLAIESATEVDAASDIAINPEPVFNAEQAAEIDAASDVTYGPDLVFNTEQAGEIDAAQDVVFTPEPVLTLEQAVEVDAAQDASLAPEPVFVVEAVTEVDAAFDVVLAPEPVLVLEQASEVDSAADIVIEAASGFSVELASEIDSASDVVLAPEPLYSEESAAEVDVASDVSLSPEPVFNVEQAQEVDAASDVVFEVIIGLNVEQANEVDAAADVIFTVEPVFVVEAATETDRATDPVFAPEPSFSTEQASEIDSAADVVFEVEIPVEVDFFVELAAEIDTALDAAFLPEPLFAVTQALEVDVAHDVSLAPTAQVDTINEARSYRDRSRRYAAITRSGGDAERRYLDADTRSFSE